MKATSLSQERRNPVAQGKPRLIVLGQTHFWFLFGIIGAAVAMTMLLLLVGLSD
jgi:hypothetical protein